MYFNDQTYPEVPLIDRKQVLRGLPPDSDLVVGSGYIREEGRASFGEAVDRGLEGIMVKVRMTPPPGHFRAPAFERLLGEEVL